MRMCKEHWDMCRKSIEDHGMFHLVAKNGEEAANNAVKELKGEKAPFDPLMSMNWHWTNNALGQGGLYLMGQTEDGSNDGHYCPLCEFEKHSEGFEAQTEVDIVSKMMRVYCINEGLVHVH